MRKRCQQKQNWPCLLQVQVVDEEDCSMMGKR